MEKTEMVERDEIKQKILQDQQKPITFKQFPVSEKVTDKQTSLKMNGWSKSTQQ